MEIFDTTITSIVGLILLMVVLRRRTSVCMLIGSLVLCLSQIFPLAVIFVGSDRMNSLIEGQFFESSDESRLTMNGNLVSEAYFIVQIAAGTVAQVGTLLVAVGLFTLVRRQILAQQHSLQL